MYIKQIMFILSNLAKYLGGRSINNTGYKFIANQVSRIQNVIYQADFVYTCKPRLVSRRLVCNS